MKQGISLLALSGLLLLLLLLLLSATPEGRADHRLLLQLCAS